MGDTADAAEFDDGETACISAYSDHEVAGCDGDYPVDGVPVAAVVYLSFLLVEGALVPPEDTVLSIRWTVLLTCLSGCRGTNLLTTALKQRVPWLVLGLSLFTT